jgi:hypothetical protein
MEREIEALATYPMESDDWIVTVLIGGIATLLSIFILPIFVVTGYMVRAIRAGMDGADEPPVFDDWGTLLKEGVVAAVINIVYQIIPIIVFIVFVGGSVASMATGSEAGAAAGLAGFLGGLFIWGILSLIFGYIGLAGVANYAREGTFGAGFDFGTIRQVLLAKEYLVAWAYAILINVAFGVVTGMLNIIPFLGAIVSVFISFYGLMIVGWVFGDGFAAALEDADSADTTGSETI